jgi:O-antigen ligase
MTPAWFERAANACAMPVQRALLTFAAIYLALIPVATLGAARAVAFATASALAAVVVANVRRPQVAPIPSPGVALAVATCAYMLWQLASASWSVHPQYTYGELRGELVWNALTIAIFYVAMGVPYAWPVLTSAALGGLAVSALASLAVQLDIVGWNGAEWYGSVGFFSTYLVCIAPLVLSLTARPTRGWAGAPLAAFVLLALAFVAARHTDNRMVWIALASVFAVAATLAALRWHAALTRAPWRWAAALVALAIALGALFVDAAKEKARKDFPPRTTIAQTFADDPRIRLWEATRELIAERPLVGHGLGRSIVADELEAKLNDPLLLHAHNMFVSQWLQTGAIGVALLVAMLAALIARYASFYRSADDRLAFLGVVGVALVVGFVVKNLTDDFLYRATAREFYALNAILVGCGVRIARTAASAQPR